MTKFGGGGDGGAADLDGAGADIDGGRPDIRTQLRAEGLDTVAWSSEAGDRYAAHHHAYDKVIAVEAGSIRYSLLDRGMAIDLDVGDRLELPAGTTHDAHVGPDGVTCLEAHLSAGTLDGLRRAEAGSW